MAYQCKQCGDNLISSPDQQFMDNICDECYKEHFKSSCECTCTEHDMCGFCQEFSGISEADFYDGHSCEANTSQGSCDICGKRQIRVLTPDID